MSSYFPSPYSSLPSLWYKLILVSSVHRMLFQNCEGFFRCCLANSNLAFLFLRLTNGLHLVVNLCIHSGEVFSWLLTLTHIHLPPGECSWSGQLLWRVFFFTRERIIRSSTTVVFCGLLVLLSSPVRSFFLECSKQLFWPRLMFLLSLWWVCLFFQPNDGLLHW